MKRKWTREKTEGPDQPPLEQRRFTTRSLEWVPWVDVDFSAIQYRAANFLIQQEMSFEMALEGCRRLHEKFQESIGIFQYLRWWLGQQAAPMEFDSARMQVVLRDGTRINAGPAMLSGWKPQYTRRFQFQMTERERWEGKKVGEVEMLEDDFDEWERTPKRQSMRRFNRKRKKSLLDCDERQRDTRPLKRWLRGQHGRPWDHVWSEAVRRCSRWERDELYDLVMGPPERGEFYIAPDKTLAYRPQRKSRLDWRTWAVEYPPTKNVHIVGDRVFFKIDGFWYEITTRPAVAADKNIFDDLVHDVWFLHKLEVWRRRWDGKKVWDWYESQFATRIVTGKKRLSSFALTELLVDRAYRQVHERLDARARPPHNGVHHPKVPKNHELKSGVDEKKIYAMSYKNYMSVYLY